MVNSKEGNQFQTSNLSQSKSPNKNTLLKNVQAKAESNFFKRVFFSPTQEEFYFFSPTLRCFNFFCQRSILKKIRGLKRSIC